jgi:hypothetical protein
MKVHPFGECGGLSFDFTPNRNRMRGFAPLPGRFLGFVV